MPRPDDPFDHVNRPAPRPTLLTGSLTSVRPLRAKVPQVDGGRTVDLRGTAPVPPDTDAAQAGDDCWVMVDELGDLVLVAYQSPSA